MKYPYFRGLEADRYSFYRVPKALIKVDLFEKMSGDAKLLYQEPLLLSRQGHGSEDQLCGREPIRGHAEKMRKDTSEIKKEESRRKFTL